MTVAVVLTGRHRPHQVLFLVFSVLAGAAFFAGARPPSSLEQLVPAWVLWTWYALLLTSGVVGLAALIPADAYRALVMERAAMVGQTVAPALYTVALASTGQPAAFFAATSVLAWGAASAWRGWQVNRGIRALRQVGERR
ncbi:MAG TPA: hypothetical protein VFR67_05980 [Pilimelia sp.]|nr:hypothetical protein [Pilimelia sp.]